MYETRDGKHANAAPYVALQRTIINGIAAHMKIVGDTKHISIPSINKHILALLFMKSAMTGNTRRPKPFDKPQMNMTVVTNAMLSPAFFNIGAQFPMSTKPALMFKNMNVQSFQKVLSLKICL